MASERTAVVGAGKAFEASIKLYDKSFQSVRPYQWDMNYAAMAQALPQIDTALNMIEACMRRPQQVNNFELQLKRAKVLLAKCEICRVFPQDQPDLAESERAAATAARALADVIVLDRRALATDFKFGRWAKVLHWANMAWAGALMALDGIVNDVSDHVAWARTYAQDNTKNYRSQVLELMEQTLALCNNYQSGGTQALVRELQNAGVTRAQGAALVGPQGQLAHVAFAQGSAGYDFNIRPQLVYAPLPAPANPAAAAAAPPQPPAAPPQPPAAQPQLDVPTRLAQLEARLVPLLNGPCGRSFPELEAHLGATAGLLPVRVAALEAAADAMGL